MCYGVGTPLQHRCSQVAAAKPCMRSERLPLSQRRTAVKPRCQKAGPSRTLSPAGFAAGPSDLPPGYEELDNQLLNRAIMSLFRQKMVQAIEVDSQQEGYHGIIDLTRKLNSKFKSPQQTQAVTQAILRSLFPSWLPGAFKVMFSKPLPSLSCRLNAWVTSLTCQWLMGRCSINDVEVDGGRFAAGHGVLVERCRYLEESGCAAICINSCKLPTQRFFAEDMGLPLAMTPNYEDFSCQFSFGKTPVAEAEDEALRTPCFAQCPSKQRIAAQQCGGIASVPAV